MKKNLDNNLRTRAYVLRRTNYEEADRIINFITPFGKISAIAKGVRKERSKLAGGIEMFSLIDINIYQGRKELGVLTSAKMIKYYNNIVTDLDRMELASLVLKKINVASENSSDGIFFKIIDQSLEEINNKTELDLVEAWFFLNIVKAMGEEVNVYRDVAGKKLEKEKKYNWDRMELAFFEEKNGEFGENEIKMLRLMLTNSLRVVKKVKVNKELLLKILYIARSVAKV